MIRVKQRVSRLSPVLVYPKVPCIINPLCVQLSWNLYRTGLWIMQRKSTMDSPCSGSIMHYFARTWHHSVFRINSNSYTTSQMWSGPCRLWLRVSSLPSLSSNRTGFPSAPCICITASCCKAFLSVMLSLCPIFSYDSGLNSALTPPILQWAFFPSYLKQSSPFPTPQAHLSPYHTTRVDSLQSLSLPEIFTSFWVVPSISCYRI